MLKAILVGAGAYSVNAAASYHPDHGFLAAMAEASHEAAFQDVKAIWHSSKRVFETLEVTTAQYQACAAAFTAFSSKAVIRPFSLFFVFLPFLLSYQK